MTALAITSVLSSPPSPVSPALASLTRKALRRQWSADDRLDWSLDIASPAGLRPGVYVDMVSQLYYAETITLEVLRRMQAGLPEAEAQAYLATQVADEDRHAEVYRRYLIRLGDLAPIDPGLAEVFAAALAFDGPAWGLVVALNVVMEHEALHQQQKRIATLPCPLFRQLNQAIVADEARHAAFGVLYLEHALPRASADDKARVMAWIRELWRMWQDANRGRYLHDGEEVLRLGRDELGERGRRVGSLLQTLGLTDDAALA